jgi:hypothetical protein
MSELPQPIRLRLDTPLQEQIIEQASSPLAGTQAVRELQGRIETVFYEAYSKYGVMPAAKDYITFAKDEVYVIIGRYITIPEPGLIEMLAVIDKVHIPS